MAYGSDLPGVCRGQSLLLGRFEQDFVVIQKMLLAGAMSLLLFPVRDNRTLMHGVIYPRSRRFFIRLFAY